MVAEAQAVGGALDANVIVGVVGAGAMGSGIAQVAALAGHRVRLFDVRQGAAQAAVESVLKALEKLVVKQKLSGEDVQKARDRLQAIKSLNELAGCGLVIEAIVEELAAKQALLRSIEGIVGPSAILATNTSSISVTAIGSALKVPEQLAGMHFFNPAPVMPLVEVIRGASTSETVMDTIYATAKAWGKVPVRARSTPGFIVNRVARPFYAEALRVLGEGAADCATIDAVMREAGGFRMGPFELMDLIGNDVNYAVTRSVFDAFYGDPRFTPSQMQLELVEAGRLGRKAGRGFYDYRDGAAVIVPATAASAAVPGNIKIFGKVELANALGERLTAAGIEFERFDGALDDRAAECDKCVLYQTDGRTATARAAESGVLNSIVMDLALDARRAKRMAIAAADQAAPLAVDAATGLLQAAGYAVSVIDDVPGMIVMRTVAMLANEAADAVLQGVSSADDVDLAMRKGVNYPLGPLAWAEAVGLEKIVRVLDHLDESYGEDRYRVSPLLRRKALARTRFTSGEPGASEHA